MLSKEISLFEILERFDQAETSITDYRPAFLKPVQLSNSRDSMHMMCRKDDENVQKMVFLNYFTGDYEPDNKTLSNKSYFLRLTIGRHTLEDIMPAFQ
jgi:hypothetical protein